jgi:hypothetical protein
MELVRKKPWALFTIITIWKRFIEVLIAFQNGKNTMLFRYRILWLHLPHPRLARIGQPHLLHRVKKDWKRSGDSRFVRWGGGWSQRRRQQKAWVSSTIFPLRRIPLHLQYKKYIYPLEYGPFHNTSDTKSLGADMYVRLTPEVTQTLPEVNHNQYQYILVLCHRYIPRE